MSKFKYLMFLILVFGGFVTKATAATCSYEERAQLNSEVSNISANYEVITVELDPDEYSPPDAILGTEGEADFVATTDALQVNVLNLTENVYAEVTNNYDNQTVVYNYADTNNGNIEIVWRTLGELVTYTIRIYASDATGCSGTLLRTLRVSLPRYNDYSTYAICDQVPDYYLCQRYVFFDQIEFSEFSTNITEEIESMEEEETQPNPEEDKTWYEEIADFISEHKVPVIVGAIVVVVATGVIVVLIVKKRRRSVI